jgi:hypothetical protein
VEKLELLCTVDGTVTQCNQYGKQHGWKFLKKKIKNRISIRSSNLVWVHMQKNRKQGFKETFAHPC